MQDMYRKHGMYKNYEEYCYLVLEEEVCFVLLGFLRGFPFFRQLMLRVFPSFSLTRDNDSCSDHTFDNLSIVSLTYLSLDLFSSWRQTSFCS